LFVITENALSTAAFDVGSDSIGNIILSTTVFVMLMNNDTPQAKI
jgi:hypothetical protein